MSEAPHDDFDQEADRLLRMLRGRRTLARLTLWFEQFWPAVWPALGIAGVFVCVALLGVLRLVPSWLHFGFVAAMTVAFLVLLVRGMRRVSTPDDASADRRLERASGMRHRPLSVLTDRPARADGASDPVQDALWRAHVERMVAKVRRLRVGLPRPGLARLDRHALRGGLVVALVAALTIAGADAPARLLDAVTPALPLAPPPPAAQLQVWITPPAYTGQAPLFLKPDAAPPPVPHGAHVTASLTGGEGGAPVLTLNGRSTPFRALDAASFQSDVDLTSGGRLEVRRDGRMLAGWDVAVVENRAPAIAWAEPPGQAPRGLQTRLPWQASDDYGVVRLQAELRLDARPDAPPLVVSIPVPGGATKAAKGVGLQDLTANPWAGLKVTARLVGQDAAGLTGRSADAGFKLPERNFRHPVARLLIGIRQGLSLDPEDRASAVGQLDKLLMLPDAMGNDVAAYLNLADIYYRLVRDRAPEAVGEAQALMWQLALHLEEGGTERTARALEAAREAVREAMDRATSQPNEANRSELEKRIQELEQAIREHMQALAEQARREHAETPYDPNAQHLDSRDIERQAEAAREAARQGRMDEARERMAQLEQMLDQLRNARPEHGQPNPQAAQKRQRGRQQMGAVQDMIGRQGGLLDHAQQRAGQDPLSQRPQSGQQSGKPRAGQKPGDAASASPSEEREADKRVQQALRRALGELMQQFGDLTSEIPQSLSDADEAMRQSGQALGQGKDGAAGQAQQKAIEALQKGGREMAQQMARQFGQSGQSGEGEDGGDPGGQMGFSLQDGPGQQDGESQGTLPGQRGRGDKRDPLGRQLGQGNSGDDESDSVRVPEEMERQRTRMIQEELRRRGAERTRPQPELDYIDRLLKQF